MRSDLPWWYGLVFAGCGAVVAFFALPPSFWNWKRVALALLVTVPVVVLLFQGRLSAEAVFLGLGFAYTLWLIWMSGRARLNTPVYLGFLAALGVLTWVQAAGSWRFLSPGILAVLLAEGWYAQAEVWKMIRRPSAGPGADA